MRSLDALVAEKWRPVAGWEGVYSVSSCGRVRSEARTVQRAGSPYAVPSRIMKLSPHKRDYRAVALCRQGCRENALVHRLVARAFCRQKPGHNEVNHINGVGSDNRRENLEWCNRALNNLHAFRVLGRKITPQNGEANRQSRLTSKQVHKIRKMLSVGMGEVRIGRVFGVNPSTIGRIRRGELWKNVGVPQAEIDAAKEWK